MSRFILSVSLLALIAGGCRTNDGSPQVSSQARAKPVVAIVPIIDNTKNEVRWNLSDELSSALYARIAQRNHLTTVASSLIRSQVKKSGDQRNPFSPDVSWVKHSFQGQDFVVFLELIEHEEVLRQNRRAPTKPEHCSADLNMSMRVRILDVRGETPRIILQELVHDTHFIPRQFTQVNFYQVAWGTESFSISPMGLAHEKFIREMAERIEDYILINK